MAKDNPLHYSSKMDVNRIIGDISATLVKRGCSKITVDYEESIPVALTFYMLLTVNGDKVPTFYNLPARWEGMLRVLEAADIPRANKNKKQAIITAWKNILTWVEAQMAMIDAELCDVQEVFMPYLVMNNGETIYNNFKKNPQLLLK